MFKRIDDTAPDRYCTISIDGMSVRTPEGTSVALALLTAGVPAFRRTPVSGAPRSPLCLMGVCFDCLVTIDGQPNVQACMAQARDGMRVQVQLGAATVPEAA
ncbi:(2Fe-2S)-binding protein [Achromobacter xylosoxidans]